MANGLLTDQQEQSLFDRIFAGRKSNIAGDIFKPKPEGFYSTKQKDEMAAQSQAREQAYNQDTTSISDKQRTQSQSLLPEATVTGKSFKDQLNSVADKIFNMQSNDPEGYAAMLSGLDLYSRSQTQDFATAMLGNNKYNKDQAAALMQANMNATNQKLNEMKVLKAGLRDHVYLEQSIDMAKKMGLTISEIDILATTSKGIVVSNQDILNHLASLKNKTQTRDQKILARQIYDQQAQK